MIYLAKLDNAYKIGYAKDITKRIKNTTSPTIDLISIGIVSEDNREYYAISKDFNLKEAWNRYDEKINTNYNPEISESTYNTMYLRTYWIRENVLKPIWIDLYIKENKLPAQIKTLLSDNYLDSSKYTKEFTYSNFKKLINKYGKSNKQISEEVYNFCKPLKGEPIHMLRQGYEQVMIGTSNIYIPPLITTEWVGKRDAPKFYGYYSAYDHVALCWLFGKMLDLPKGFPMYTIDLKQIMDDKASNANPLVFNNSKVDPMFLHKLDWVKNHPNYPKQANEHSAIHDARWNKELHKFLKQL